MSYFTFNCRNIYYNVIGTGVPLLFIAGNTASSKMFHEIINFYSDDFMVILLDFPGHGNSERLDRFEEDFWYYNSTVCYALLNHLKLTKVSVIGSSGGALVGINLALEHPECVQYLIADSFIGEYPFSNFERTLEQNRETSKKSPPAKEFWAFNHGNDWETIVDLDTKMQLEFLSLHRSYFHKPISDLLVPSLFTGSKEDELISNIEKVYFNLRRKNNHIQIFLFDNGYHPAILSNQNEFCVITKEFMQNAT